VKTSSPNVLYEVRDRVATITLNRPGRRNALSPAMLSDLLQCLATAGADPGVRAVVLTGAGERAFCSGLDLGRLAESGATDLELHAERSLFVDVSLACERLGKPLIGCINGHALAGGFGLALSCDLLIAADTATFGTPEINVGLWPMMVMAIIVRNLGRKRAMELFMTGERVDAVVAQGWGLVNRVVSPDAVRATAHDLARSLCEKSPLVMKLGRDAFYRTADQSFEESLRYLHAQLTVVGLTDDAKEGVAAFLAKRDPTFTGR